MLLRRPLAGALLALAAGTLAGAQQVTWVPERPEEGSLVVLRVAVPAGAVRGIAAGEPLHFYLADSGSSWALAPIPLGTVDSLLVGIVVSGAGRADEIVTVSIPVTPRIADTDFLRTPQSFLAPPDSALQARIAAERVRMHAVEIVAHLTARVWRGPFIRPLGGRVTTPFGEWRGWDDSVAGRHEGVDLAGARGTAVRAANRGVIALVANQYYGGVTVLIDHGAGLVTSYQHLSAATVAEGDTVATGDVIGRVGATGRATGPHLDWAAWYGRVSVDPFALLTLQLLP